MLFKTHLVFAFFVGLLGIMFIHPANQILFMALVLFGGALPDIDHPKSKIGRFARPINFLFEHRGFFHSFLMIPVLGAFILLVLGLPQYAIPKLLGYASHLVTDMATVEGIMPLHPLSRFRIKGFMKTGGPLEMIFFVVMIFASGYVLVNM